MAAKWIEALTGSLEQKKQYREYVARIDALPEPYTSAAKAMHRYSMYSGGITDGEAALKVMGHIVELWERAAADGTPVRDIVGNDPVELTDTIVQTYAGKQWIDKERKRLTDAMDRAAGGPA